MKLEDRLRRELHDTAEHLIISPDKYEEVVRAGRRRRRLLLASGVLGSVAIAGAVVLALSLQPVSHDNVAVDSPTSVPPITTTAPVVTPSVGSAVLVAGPDGIRIAGRDGEQILLEGDLYYEGISWVISDGAGGLIYQHDVTPLPWKQGTIMRLPAGASKPHDLVSPPDGGYLRPLDVDLGFLMYRQDTAGTSQVLAIDLATLESHLVIPPTPLLVGASAESGQVVAVLGGDCSRFTYYHIDGRVSERPPWDDGGCLPASVNDVAFNGRFIFTLEDADTRELVRRDFITGIRTMATVEDGWQIWAGVDGTVAVGGTRIRVGRFDDTTFTEEFETDGANSFAIADLAAVGANATLGSNLGQLPCTPIEVGNPVPQGLPEQVENRRSELFLLAASCDMEVLARLARSDETAFTFGGEADPLRSWIRSARNGFDVMTWIVRILGTTPAVDTNGSYVWPAVHVTNSDEDWRQLSGVFTAAEYEQYYSMRASGYLGLRIGIAADGTWLYAIAGD